MEINKKTKVKKMKGNQVPFKERLGGLMYTVIALAIAVVVFVGFIFLQNYFSEKISYKEVFVVKTEIPAGEIITESNIANYFGKKQINALDAVEGAYTPADYEKLYGMRTKVVLHVGEEVSESDFENVNVYLDIIENPVELSFATSGMETTDGGKIRAGDIVNITLMFTKEQLGLVGYETESSSSSFNGIMIAPSETGVKASDYYASNNNSKDENIGKLNQVNSENTEKYNFELYARYMLENMYIKKVLTADGVEIAPTDTESVAGIIVLVVPKNIELELNTILGNCTSMRISKVLYEITPEDLFNDPSLKDDIGTLEELEPNQEETEPEVVEEPVEAEISVENLPEEGWVEVEGVFYLPTEEAGISHYKKDAEGNVSVEECVLTDGVCEFCKAIKTDENASQPDENASEPESN